MIELLVVSDIAPSTAKNFHALLMTKILMLKVEQHCLETGDGEPQQAGGLSGLAGCCKPTESCERHMHYIQEWAASLGLLCVVMPKACTV